MRNVILYVFVLFNLTNCSKTEKAAEKSVIEPAQTGILTHQVSFGNNDGFPEEYLLVKPKSIAVSKDSSILIVDENRIKIFNGSGKPERIAGKPGQGPGEYINAQDIIINKQGYITVKEPDGLNLLSPDFNYVKKQPFWGSEYAKRIKKMQNLTQIHLKSGLYINKNSILVYTAGLNSKKYPNRIEWPRFYFLGLLSESGIKPLWKADKKFLYSNVEAGIRCVFPLEFLEKFIWEYSTEGYLVMAETDKDNIVSETTSEYSLNFLLLESGEKFRITKEYERAQIGKNETRLWEDINDSRLENFEKFKIRLNGICAEEKYCKSLQNIKTDGDLIFAFTHKRNEKNEIYTDLFSAGNRKYLKSVWFPEIPDVVRNGYVYYLFKGTSEEFPEVKKYKIDPAVYSD